MKHFRGWNFDGTTFGMEIDATTPAYRALKKNTRPQDVTGRHGIRVNVLACPARYVAGVMREAAWLVSEKQSFRKIQIDDGEDIFVEYPDGVHI